MPIAGATTARARRRLIVLIAVIFVLVVLSAPSASAHAIVEKTLPGIDEIVPQAPERVVMGFNEPVEIAFGAIRVFDTNGDRVDVGDTQYVEGPADEIEVALEPDLRAGTYTVAWRVVSADAHPISEAFVFHVQHPGTNPAGLVSELLEGEQGASRTAGALFGVVRWLGFFSMLVLVGAVAFYAIVWRSHPVVDAAGAFMGRLWRVVTASWIAALAASLLALPLQAAVAGGLGLSAAVSPGPVSDVLGTRFGTVMAIRVIALLVFGAIGVTALRAGSLRAGGSVGAAYAEPRELRPILAVMGVLSAFLLATPGLAGHAGSTSPVGLTVVLDMVHLLAAATWIGGLVALTFVAFPTLRVADGRETGRRLAPLVSRFSDVAVVAVTVVVITGTFRAWQEVGAWGALTGTTYGWVLLAKVATFAPLLALGVVNNRILKPRLQDDVDGVGRPALATLRRTVAAEVALSVVVIALTAFLVNLSPARIDAGVDGPFVADVTLGPYRLNVLVQPNEIGANEMHLTATQESGAPASIRAMEVFFRMPEQEIGPLPAEGRRLAPGHFVVQGHQLSVAGRWQLEIVARTGAFEDHRTTISIDVNDD